MRRKNNDPVGEMSRLMAKLFAFMAAEIIERCGEDEGSKVVSRAVYKFGVHRGRLRREAALAAGEKPTIENFEKFGDLPHSDAWDSDTETIDGRLYEYTRFCPMADAWREIGMEEVGSLYCPVDAALAEGYFEGGYTFDRKLFITDGSDAPCDMTISLE